MNKWNFNLYAGNEDGSKLMIHALESLYRKFDPNTISERPGAGGKKLLYVEAHEMINYMNQEFGLLWSSYIKDFKIESVKGSKDKEAISCVIVSVETHIKILDQVGKEIYHSSRPGIGGDSIAFASDIDKNTKTAMANAIKKSLMNFGLSLYLWEEEERNNVYEGKRASTGLTDRNKNILNKFGSEYSLGRDDVNQLIESIFKDGVDINGSVIIGTDLTCFYHYLQDNIVDKFIELAAEKMKK